MRMGSSSRRNAAGCECSRAQQTCLAVLLLLSAAATVAECQIAPFPPPGLSETFYDTTCPNLFTIVSDLVKAAVKAEARMAASLLRLHFHDCWPNGCDASLLLDATPTFQSEKNAPPNNNSLRGFDVIDQIKAAVEKACPKTVSCADILTLAALDAVVAAGGVPWPVALGRRDSTTSAFAAAAAFLPTPDMNLPALIQNFARVGFSTEELITLSGAHTIGRAKCASIEARLYPTPEADINKSFLKKLQQNCPKNGNVSVLNNFDQATPDLFDNAYYQNLQQGKGLLHSDQALFSTQGSNVATVNLLASASGNFLGDFADAMIKLDDISPLTGKQGQIRVNCHKVNSPAISEMDSTDIDTLIALE
jgi:peroxidase